MGLFVTGCGYAFILSVAGYLLPFLFVRLYRSKNLKRAYDARWGLVTGASSGERLGSCRLNDLPLNAFATELRASAVGLVRYPFLVLAYVVRVAKIAFCSLPWLNFGLLAHS